jgi:hypothetical protein
MERDARRRHVRDRARRVVAQARLLDERLGRACALSCFAPGSLLGREERELCLSHEDDVHGADGHPLLDRRPEVVRGASGCAEQRMGNASNEERIRDPATFG